MTDLSQALAEISHIRAQVARGTQFRGYGPASIAVSGFLALAVATAQAALCKAGVSLGEYLVAWVGTAIVSVTLAVAQTIARARRMHSGLALPMIQSAAEPFLPAAMVGMLLTGVVLWSTRANAWMLPGLWQLIFSLGVFASCRLLPRPMFAVGVWYLTCGLACLILGSDSRQLSPWEMGVPFGMGQLLVAAVLRFGFKESIEEQ